MSDLKLAYAAYNEPSNSAFPHKKNWYNFGESSYSEIPHEKYQDHKMYSGDAYIVGMKDVFGKNDFSQEPVGLMFFSEKNIKRLQQKIKSEIFRQTNGKLILEEDQDINDLLISMRAMYQLHGKYLPTMVVHQVKDLNKKLVKYVTPDMMTEIKQYYGYLKDVNEPLKPIDRPMNVSNAGRRLIPSITTMWSSH